MLLGCNVREMEGRPIISHSSRALARVTFWCQPGEGHVIRNGTIVTHIAYLLCLMLTLMLTHLSDTCSTHTHTHTDCMPRWIGVF